MYKNNQNNKEIVKNNKEKESLPEKTDKETVKYDKETLKNENKINEKYEEEYYSLKWLVP